MIIPSKEFPNDCTVDEQMRVSDVLRLSPEAFNNILGDTINDRWRLYDNLLFEMSNTINYGGSIEDHNESL